MIHFTTSEGQYLGFLFEMRSYFCNKQARKKEKKRDEEHPLDWATASAEETLHVDVCMYIFTKINIKLENKFIKNKEF